MDLLDEIETVLQIRCAPITWPIGMGKRFKGVYHLYEDRVILYGPSLPTRAQSKTEIKGLNNPELDDLLGDQADELRMEIELVQGAADSFDHDAYLRGELSPVYFGSAMNNFGVQELLDGFVESAPGPQPRPSTARDVLPTEEKFSGFVFKIQANMDPQHRDRIAFLRICSGKFTRGMKVKHVRLNRDIKIPDALTFMSSDRETSGRGLSGRHHRYPQPRHDPHRRYLHRRRAIWHSPGFRTLRRNCSAGPVSRIRSNPSNCSRA